MKHRIIIDTCEDGTKKHHLQERRWHRTHKYYETLKSFDSHSDLVLWYRANIVTSTKTVLILESL